MYMRIGIYNYTCNYNTLNLGLILMKLSLLYIDVIIK